MKRMWLSKSETVTFRHIDFHDKGPDGRDVHTKKNYGLSINGRVTFRPGKCPCTICGHTNMDECYEADCQCCSSVCT